MASQKVFDADLASFNREFERLNAIVTGRDANTGEQWTGVDLTKVPGKLARSYRRFLSYGAANGLLPQVGN